MLVKMDDNPSRRVIPVAGIDNVHRYDVGVGLNCLNDSLQIGCRAGGGNLA